MGVTAIRYLSYGSWRELKRDLLNELFEDGGYFCVDNLPSEMIRSLVDLFMHRGSKVQRAAVVSDVRGGTYFEGFATILDELRAGGGISPLAMATSRYEMRPNWRDWVSGA